MTLAMRLVFAFQPKPRTLGQSIRHSVTFTARTTALVAGSYAAGVALQHLALTLFPAFFPYNYMVPMPFG